MTKIWLDNESIFDLLLDNGVTPICGADMQLYVTDDEAKLIPVIFQKFGISDSLYGFE